MKDLFTSFLSTGAIQVANLVTGILAARLLLPEGRGELAFLLLWPALIADMGALGVNTAASYHTARRSFSPERIFAGTAVIVAVLSPVLMGIFALLMPVLFADYRADLILVGAIFLVFIPVHLGSHCLISQLQGAQEFTLCNLLRAVLPYAYLVFVLLCVWLFEASPENFAYAFLGANVVAFAAGLLFAGRRGWISLRASREVVRALLSYGARFHVSMLLAIANRRLDLILITLVLPPAQLGLYVVATAVQGLPMLVASTMDILVFPKIAAGADEAERQAVLARYLRATLILVVPATIVLLVIAQWLVRVVFGEAFAGATDVVRILLVAGLPFTFKTLASSYFRAGNRMAVVSKAEMIGMIVSAAALFALVPAFGIVGAAIAQVFAFLVPAAYILLRARIDLRLDLLSLVRFDGEDAILLRDAMRRLTRGRTA
ncbi:MAG: oligosaccharide flippase family protein [Rhodospirillaceae bacterium]